MKNEEGRSKMTARKVGHYGHEGRRTHGYPIASKHPERPRISSHVPHPTSAAASHLMRENGRAKQDDGGADLFTILSPARHGKRALLATDAEVMGLEHRKLGIKPFGTEWDLRGQLKAGDKTLEVMQVAAAIMANPNLEVCPFLSIPLHQSGSDFTSEMNPERVYTLPNLFA